MTRTKCALFSTAAIIVATLALATTTTIKAYADDAVTIVVADPNEQSDGTMGPAAAAAKAKGALPFSAADVAAKAAADQAYQNAARSGAHPSSAAEPAATGAPGPQQAPTVVGTLNFAGLAGGTASTNTSPPDNEGAIGTTRYIQTINAAVRISNRSTGAALANGTLNQLAGIAATVNSFDPQIIWDPTTNRFYYLMDSIFSGTDNRLSFGFSKTASPANVTTQWCHYSIKYGTPFPDYPKLGDSQFFTIFGVNVFANNAGGGFVGSDILAVSKPANGNITTCPAVNTFKTGKKAVLKDTGNNVVFTPVPSNQIDSIATGYVVARNGGLPANKLWFFNVTKNATTGAPVFGNARGVTVNTYSVPPNAAQPQFSQLIATSDTRNTQAVQARNIGRPGVVNSFWTQHTVANGSFSAVRWYEINPVPAAPVLLRTGDVTAANSFIFNGAISPDRKVNGATTAFGNSFVIQYNATSVASNIFPRILAGSSVNGAPVEFALVKNATVPYRDFTCQAAGSVCRWGDYAAATPDPAPTTTGTGEVWGTNQFSAVFNAPPNAANWVTQIFALKP